MQQWGHKLQLKPPVKSIEWIKITIVQYTETADGSQLKSLDKTVLPSQAGIQVNPERLISLTTWGEGRVQYVTIDEIRNPYMVNGTDWINYSHIEISKLKIKFSAFQ